MSTTSTTEIPIIESLSETGISIPDLTNLSSPANNDLLIIQDVSEGENGLTKNISISQLSDQVATSIFNTEISLTNTNNIFSGSFYGTKTGIPANFHNLIIRNDANITNDVFIGDNLNVSGSSTFLDNITVSSGDVSLSSGDLTVVTGDLTISAGTTTLQSLSCGNINGSGTVSGTIITATTRFVGNFTGSVMGDIYSPTGILILDNGSGTANDSNFYGTSSYSTTSSYVNSNGVPSGGTLNQVLTKDSSTDYDYSWSDASGTSESQVKTIVSSSLDGSNNFFAKFVGDKFITSSLGMYENSGTETIIFQAGYDVSINTGNFTISNGNINVITGDITSSNGILTNNVTLEETSSIMSGSNIIVYGDQYAHTTLELSSSNNVTMSLKSGQSAYVAVINESNHTISAWSSSFDGGVTVSEKVYWSGSAAPTIQTGAMDLYSFRNINNKIFGSAIQNFS